MPLGRKVGLGPGHFVLDGAQPPPQKKGAQTPIFRPMSIVAKRSPISATAEHLSVYVALACFVGVTFYVTVVRRHHHVLTAVVQLNLGLPVHRRFLPPLILYKKNILRLSGTGFFTGWMMFDPVTQPAVSEH